MAHRFEADDTIDPDALAGKDDTAEQQDDIGDSAEQDQQSDEAAIWKNKYMRLLADLENTKKRLTRSSAREVEQEKEALLSHYEVKEIESLGKGFDPRIHEAVGVTRNPKFPSNTVVKVQQQGYFYRDKLLRPAQVMVNQS